MQQLSNNYKDPSRIHPKFIRNSSKNHPKSIPNPSKIDEKSRLRRGCVFGGARDASSLNSPDPFGDHFPSKIEQIAYNSVKGSPNGAKSWKKRHLKIYAKNDAEQEAKMMPKGCQNYAKMDAKIDEKSM